MEKINTEKLFRQRERLDQALNGKANKAVEDIKEALKKNNIDATPEIALDTCVYAIEELHIESLNFPMC